MTAGLTGAQRANISPVRGGQWPALRWVCAAVGSVLLADGLVLMALGYFSMGVTVPAVLGAAGSWLAWRWRGVHAWLDRTALRLKTGEKRQHVGLEHVAANERNVRWHPRRQLREQVAIDFHSEDRRAGLGKREGQRALAGTDLEKNIARLRIDRVDNLVRPLR